MSESDERLDTVSDRIDEAKSAAKSLAEQDVIDPKAVAGDEPLPDHDETAPEQDEPNRAS